ncbi:hypothetical protein QBC34DRAFT_388600 [Podospora aff. communis PSN243]|uniref:Dehydrogenase n=1 Tax=Podospora aff. communis PSN243 TaxID=3040156 RepID=A0AAV9H4K1_9PEZI|nr:hypothetical protein QBC34DRAFT_388600 [Podospora aff. communis PSN243]
MLYPSSLDSPYHPSGSTTIDPIGYGKVAIVTGCASSIGLAVTQLLLAHQFSVCGLDDIEFDYSLLREADHGRFHFHRGNLSPGDSDGAAEGLRICRGVFGERLNTLITTPSTSPVSPPNLTTALTINLTTPILMMHTVLPLMKSHRSGVIINITPPAPPGDAARTAARDGLLGATKSVAWSCRDEGIRVNAVLPGAAVEEAGEKTAAMEVARAVLFLVGDEAKGVNGVGLPVGRMGEVL